MLQGTTLPANLERSSLDAELQSEYVRRVKRGYATLAGSRIAIVGLVRNLAATLPATVARIEQLGSLAADYRVVVFENDSADASASILRRWAARNGRVTALLETFQDPVNPATRCLKRIERMARYRTLCQQAVSHICPTFDYAIVLDFDIGGRWCDDGIANTFGHREWDFVGSNGLIYRREGLVYNSLRQYDMWALRFDGAMTPLPTCQARQYCYRTGEPLVSVTSCFGGLGIYRMEAFREGRYSPSDCEHVTFHKSLIEAGHGRLFLNPSQILIYGRRNRFGDGAVRALLATWSRLTGRPAEPWHFDGTLSALRAA